MGKVLDLLGQAGWRERELIHQWRKSCGNSSGNYGQEKRENEINFHVLSHARCLHLRGK